MEVIGIPLLNNKYPVTMDLWPLEAREFNKIYEFYDNLKAGRFTTTRCKKCGHVAYPPRIICPECYSEELEYIDIPKKGKVVVFAEQLKGLIFLEMGLMRQYMRWQISRPVPPSLQTGSLMRLSPVC